MQHLLTLILILNFGLASAQEFLYPKIKKYGQTISQFIPNNWVILDTASGDLNSDKHNDIAVVLQYQDSVSIVRTEDGYKDTTITQPRILIIAFYNTISKQYELIEQSNSFILNHDNPNIDEPFDGISISKNILKIDFRVFMNAGGWGMSNNSYKFRYQNKEFKLIGAEYNYVNRASGDTEDRSYNFLTKKVRVSIGNISNDIQKTKLRTFQVKELKTLKTFSQPFTWEIEKDFYL